MSKIPRLSGVAVLVLLLSALVLFIAPIQLTVTAYKLSLVTLAAWLGYWLDRWIFPYARPHWLANVSDDDRRLLASWYMLRRAIIVAATILAVALGA